MPSLTRSAGGLDRRAFTIDEILRMREAGIIAENENFELVEGEIVPKGPKYAAHERIKSKIGMALSKAIPPNLIVGFESSIFFSNDTFLEPDICVYPERLRSQDVRGPDIILAIEIAASTLAYDRGLKARLYAGYGVHELWVIDANARRTWIHEGPGKTGWTHIGERDASVDLRCVAIPGFSMRLSEI
jgi:Uma2 family endonuclease